MKLLGRHLFIDVKNCHSALLDNVEEMVAFLRSLSKKYHLHVLSESQYKFEPQGLSVVFLLAESHLSVHTWPELQAATIDMFCCNLESPLNQIANDILDKLKSGYSICRIVPRGDFS